MMIMYLKEIEDQDEEEIELVMDEIQHIRTRCGESTIEDRCENAYAFHQCFEAYEDSLHFDDNNIKDEPEAVDIVV